MAEGNIVGIVDDEGESQLRHLLCVNVLQNYIAECQMIEHQIHIGYVHADSHLLEICNI